MRREVVQTKFGFYCTVVIPEQLVVEAILPAFPPRKMEAGESEGLP
jgi:hypothetical protein